MSNFNTHIPMRHRVFQSDNSNSNDKKEAADPPRLRRLSPSLGPFDDEETPVYTSKATTTNEIKGTILDTYIQKSWTTTPSPLQTYSAAIPSKYERRLASRAANMRFQSTSRPVLTPFGERLLVLSERKLNNLEAPLGGRDEPTLLKGVLVREAVKSAWRSVETGQQAEVNDWQSETAMGLDVIGEEDEEEEDGASEAHNHTHESVVEQRNERWFEELVESFGEDDGIETHEWIESEVGAPVDYDDFAYEEFEHYTLPSPPPPSPLQVPASPSSPSSTLSSILSPASSTVELDVEPETESSAIVDIDVVEVPDYDDDELYGDEIVSAPLRKDSIPSTPLLSAASSPSSSPIPVISLSDDELDCDDLYLPPPLHRCSSSSSLCTSDEDGDCVTPSSSCEDLELSVGSLSLEDDIVLADPGDSTRLAFDYASFARKVERWQTWDGPPLPLHAGVLGLDLDISIGMADTI